MFQRGPLPRRDLWLLPLISILTVLLLFIVTETGSRILYPEQVKNACQASDPAMEGRYLPNCTAMTKLAEGPWVTNSYNECGYRSSQPCGPVPPGTRRIAVIGTSLSEGYMVPYQQTAAAILAADLTTKCHAPVEVQNLGALSQGGEHLVSQMEAALRLEPQAVLMLFGPHDLQTPAGAENVAPTAAPVIQNSLQHRVWTLLKTSRAAVVLQSLIFRNASLYASVYLRYQDQADFLRTPLSAAWRQRLSWFDLIMGRMAGKAQAAKVPLVFAYIPLEAQAALLQQHNLPSDVNISQFSNEIAQLTARHGIIYLDTTTEFRDLADPMKVFYHVDTHLTGDGYSVIAATLAEQLTKSALSFANCNDNEQLSKAARR